MGGLLFGTALLLLVVGAPIVTALGLSSLVFIYANDIQHVVVIQKLFAGIDSAALLAVPFFILAGDLMNQGGIAKRIVNMAAVAVGNIHGGLGVVAIISCMFFAAISGSGIATAAAIGGVMMAGMLRAGYSRSFSATIVAAASPIGIIIPPSIAFIIYAVLSKVAVSDLYKVGFPAGFIVGIALIVPTILIAKKRGYKDTADQIASGDLEVIGLAPEEQRKKLKGLHYFLDSLWALGTPVIIVGGVFAGIFTPTESAVVAVIYSIIIGIFVYKEMTWKDIPRIFLSSAISTAGIMVIMAAAALFAWVMVYVKIPQTILDSVLALTTSKYLILLIINVIVLIAGMFMESGSIQYILVPIALPIALTLGIDPVHFGIMLTTNLAIGMLTPPFGITLFTSARVFGASIQDVTRETLPFLAALLVALAIITFIPQSVMWIL
ncbi:TRAP transporter large permease [Acidaminobacter hydrogenoformans]|uniref:C4-dicarboxylate transporter, DctM subunit n=1 Tax=Acidaminobacter hydrogenoformans DSM 2784 TaxID=1120920 RepID=A0A1G5RWZ5_9FIRM|nr:TRAP transporter large permease [Acidaminobacter hydrogenoformans]SCZ78566.1 C4-dicarboxylate transporter, DctM subunit [Acidaminobacter hydrogenoformans DSM 2784]